MKKPLASPSPAPPKEVDFFGAVLDPLNDLLDGWPEVVPEVVTSGTETPAPIAAPIAAAPVQPAPTTIINFDGLFKPSKRPKLGTAIAPTETGKTAGSEVPAPADS